MPYIRFLFVRPRICRRLPSDSPHGGHPCLKLTIPTIKARSGLTPYSCCPCRANMVQQGTACPLSCFVNGKLYFSLSVQCLYEKANKGCHYIYSKCPHSNFTLHRVFILILGYNSSVPFLEEKSATQQCY